MEVETRKKTEMEENLVMENLRKRIAIIEVSIANRIQEIEESISGAENTIEDMDTIVKEIAKFQKPLTPKQEIQDTMRRPNPRIIGIEESEDS